MARRNVEVVGLDDVIRDLRRFDNLTKQDIKGAHKDAAEPVKREALQLVPKRSGKLAGTLRTAGLASGGRVRAGLGRVPYAGPIHFGWPSRNIRPQPFLFDALDARRTQVVDVYERRVGEWLRRSDLD